MVSRDSDPDDMAGQSFAIDRATLGFVIAIIALLVYRPLLAVGAVAGVVLTLYLHPFRYNKYSRQSTTMTPIFSDTIRNDADSRSSTAPISLRDRMHPATRLQAERFVNLTIRDYVRWWYTPPAFSPDDEFPAACEQTLVRCFNELHTQLSSKDVVTAFRSVWMSAVATLGVVLSDLREAHAERPWSGLDLKAYVINNPDSVLAQVMGEEAAQARLAGLARRILARVLSQSDLGCHAASVFLHRIMISSILLPTITSNTHPDYINKLLLESFSEQAIAQPVVTSDQARPASPALPVEPIKDASLNHEQEKENLRPQLQHHASSASEESDDIDETTVPSSPKLDLDIQESTLRKRGRRLSFKTRRPFNSIGSIKEFEVLDEVSSPHTPKRESLLRRAFSRSRSRSSSPDKGRRSSFSHIDSPAPPHSPTPDPAKKENAPVDPKAKEFYHAKIDLYDFTEYAAGVKADSTYDPSVLPNYGIVIVKSHDLTSEGHSGYTILRNILDVLDLHRDLCNCVHGSNMVVPTFPAWRLAVYSDVQAMVAMFLQAVCDSERLASTTVFRRFCDPRLEVAVRQSDDSDSHSEALEPRSSLESIRTPEPMKSSRPSSPFRRRSPARHSIGTTHELLSAMRDDASPRPISRPSSPTRSIKSFLSEFDTPARAADRAKSSVKLTSDDVQSLIDESMELMTAFFALSPKTWSLRSSILAVLRNQYLSKSSRYSRSIQAWLEATLVEYTDSNRLATHFAAFNDAMFPDNWTPPPPLERAASKKLREEARAAFIKGAMPSAVRSLMGGNATNESLSIVFDALQEPRFTRGLATILIDKLSQVLLE